MLKWQKLESGFNEKAEQGLNLLMRLKTKICMQCHLGIHVFFFRGEKLGLHPVGCEREEEICDFSP